ncbi:MAG TPA: ABC transporter permease [Burkholderiales bacterium]|nr:ABC transporter permease [Burkholderiales bacterium]
MNVAMLHASPLRRWLRQVAAMMVKEWRQLLRDRALFAFVIFIFTLDILIAAGAPELDLRNARLGVVDRDRSAASRDLIYRLRAPYFAVQALPEDEAQLRHRLDRGELRAVLTIPHGFERDLMSGHPTALQLVIDASDANLSYLLASYTERIVAPFGAERMERRNLRSTPSAPEVRVQVRMRFNPTLHEGWFTTISELIGMVTVAAILLPAAALVREKERGTIEQLLVSPLTPLQIVVAKVMAMTVVILIGAAVAVLGVMHGWLGVPFVGSAPLFFALVALFAMTASGLGITAATFARNSGQIGLIVLLLVMPIINLSGNWNLVESMPGWLRAAINLSPLRHFVEIAYGILLKGTEASALVLPTVKMALLGAVFFAAGVLRFRRQFR